MAKVVCASSLLFAPGRRPDADALHAIAEASEAFSISYDPSRDGGQSEGWIELLANGLTFDLVGLAPHEQSGRPASAYFYGLDPDIQLADCESISLTPGPHLAGGEALFPVVRLLAALTAHLAALPGTHGVIWHAARTCSSAKYFRQGVTQWIEGSVFPGLGLTALGNHPDNGLQTEGLSLFTGQELVIPPNLYKDKSHTMKIALRLINWLVEHGTITRTESFTDPDGAPLWLEPQEGGTILRLQRGCR